MGPMRRALWLFLALLPLPLLAQEGEAPSSTRLDEANRTAAVEVRRTLDERHGGLKNKLRHFRKDDVIVVGGLFDFVQEILVSFDCPHTVVTCEELDDLQLNPKRQVLLLNCHLLDKQFPESNRGSRRPSSDEAERRLKRTLQEAGLTGQDAPGTAIRERFAEIKYFAATDYSQGAIRRIGSFVKRGGWVMSSDWALLVVERALPRTIAWTGRKTFEERIEVRPSAGAQKLALMNGVFPDKGKPRWWVEQGSYLFKIHRGSKVRKLVESRQLGARYGGNRNIAVLVEAGKGRALHVLSHFYLQSATEKDAASMQMMLLNFLVERITLVHRAEEAEREKRER